MEYSYRRNKRGGIDKWTTSVPWNSKATPLRLRHLPAPLWKISIPQARDSLLIVNGHDFQLEDTSHVGRNVWRTTEGTIRVERGNHNFHDLTQRQLRKRDFETPNHMMCSQCEGKWLIVCLFYQSIVFCV